MTPSPEFQDREFIPPGNFPDSKTNEKFRGGVDVGHIEGDMPEGGQGPVVVHVFRHDSLLVMNRPQDHGPAPQCFFVKTD
jgi:hypothetical protein